MKYERSYYPAVDWLRLTCALAVVLFHLGWSSIGGGEVTLLLPNGGVAVPGRELLWRHGSVGVPIFFVISGFVIAGSAEDHQPLGFLTSRIERLYPAVFVCAPVSAAFWWMAGRPAGKGALLLIKSWLLVPGGSWVDPPYWTLSVEMAFYAYVLLIIWFGGNRLLKLGAILLAFSSAALWSLFLVTGKAASPGWLLPAYWGMHFALGTLLYFGRQGTLGFWGALAAVLAGAAGAVQTMQLLTPEWTSLTPTVLWLGGVVVIATGPRTCTAADHPAARNAGLTTYPLYLLHFGIGLALMGLLIEIGTPPLVALAAATAILVAVAYGVARHLEPVARRGLRQALRSLGQSLNRLR